MKFPFLIPLLCAGIIALFQLHMGVYANSPYSSVPEYLLPEKGYHIAAQDSAEVDSLQIARDWVGFSQVYRRQGNIAAADSFLTMAREFASKSDQFRLNFMVTVESGQFYNSQRQPELARYYYNKAVDLVGDDVSYLAILMYNISFTYSNYYDFAKAQEYLQKSIDYRYQIDRSEPLWQANTGFTYLALGRMLFRNYRFDEAIEAFQKAYAYMLPVEERPLYLFEMNSVIGEFNVRHGNYAAALSFFLEAEQNAELLDLPTRKIISNQSLGLIYSLLGEEEKAYEYYLRAREQNAWATSIVSISRTYQRLLTLLLNKRKLDDVPVYMAEWGDYLEERPEPGSMKSYLELSAYYHSLIGQYEQAEGLFAEVDQNYSSFVNRIALPEFKWRRALNMVMIDKERGFEMAEEAIEKTDEYRRYVTITGDNRAEVFRSLNPYFALLSSYYLNEGRVDDAFRVAESAGFRAFAEDIMISSDLRVRLKETGREEEFEHIRNEIVKLENRLIASSDEEESLQINRDLRNLSLESEAIVSSLYMGDETLKSFFVPDIISLNSVRSALGENEAGLRMMVNEYGVSAILFTGNETITWSVDITQGDLRNRINNLRDGITENRPLEQVNSSLEEMGRLLFTEDARNLLLTVDRLILSPDGILSYIPFEALRLWDDRYMVEQLIVSQTPSFTVREIILERERPKRESHRALAMANPVFEQSDAPQLTAEPVIAVTRSENFRPLPFSGLEGDWLKSYFPGEVNLLSGEHASESYFSNSDLNQYSLIHFATHGIMEDTNPRLSRIVLSAPGPDETEIDGLLTVSEIYQLDLSPDLVVLSACNTGLGRLIDGEGILGFQRAFLQAGSASVAVTLWSVEDRSTAMLMRSFYQNLNRLNSEGEGMDYAKALRQARLEMISRPGFNHPYQWASFILTGI